eukprot:TRINITY_DN108617_c0_g1_i1.p1 TRINITY_DN108617_c0_g1~~TRINITY_DN108617_c0_g1_i1.p1  ORF type:complete len:558 (+),score=99.78 TRINITY_DN108617_c0_g1_i1:131-1804(+)
MTKKRKGSDLEAQDRAIHWSEDVTAAPTRRGVPLWNFASDSQESTARGLVLEASVQEEQLRASLMQELRNRYAKACHEVLGLERPPGDSVDRWLLEQLAQPQPQDSLADPMLPRPRIAETSRVLLRELLAEVPMRCHNRVTGPPALDALKRYHQSAERWLENLKAAPPQLHQEVESLGQWIQANASQARGGGARRRAVEDCPIRKKLDSLIVRTPTDMGLSVRFQVEVEPQAMEVVKIVSNEAEEVAAKLSKARETTAPAEPLQVTLEEQIDSASASSGPPPAVLKCGDDTIPVSGMHARKLRRLYEVHNPLPDSNDPEHKEKLAAWESLFRRRLYLMLRRYITFIGLDPSEEGSRGGNMHAAAPESVFAWLRAELGVRRELFASPLNCYFSQFYSAFPDTDAPFGSQGSFFDTADEALPEGSYEVGPPYTEEVMELMARKLLSFLRNSGGRALSFVIFVPDWGDECTALGLMGGRDFEPYRRSRHGGPFVLARGRDHQYISGVQFFADSGDDASRRYYVVPHGTRIYVLQNDAGASRWPFTKEKEQTLLERLKPPQ